MVSEKGERLDAGVEPPRTNLCRAPPSPFPTGINRHWGRFDWSPLTMPATVGYESPQSFLFRFQWQMLEWNKKKEIMKVTASVG